MKECVFCNIVKTGDNKSEKEKNVILYEDELILITQATGSPVRGYLMIVVKQHVNGFAELSLDELKHVEKIINKKDGVVLCQQTVYISPTKITSLGVYHL